jgi:hypothetical protein
LHESTTQPANLVRVDVDVCRLVLSKNVTRGDQKWQIVHFHEHSGPHEHRTLAPGLGVERDDVYQKRLAQFGEYLLFLAHWLRSAARPHSSSSSTSEPK